MRISYVEHISGWRFSSRPVSGSKDRRRAVTITRWAVTIHPMAGMKSADVLHLSTMLPLLVAERPQGDIGKQFQLHSDFRPAGDQPEAIEELCEAIAAGERDQVLLG